MGYLMDTIVDVHGKTGKVKVGETGITHGDIMGCYADISRISEDLGYSPMFDLKKGVSCFKEWADTYVYYLKNSRIVSIT